jgi:hypothetical protein
MIDQLKTVREALAMNRVMCEDTDGNYTVDITPKKITKALATLDKLIAEAGEPIAEIGVSSFTWLADRPPVGTKLYVHPSPKELVAHPAVKSDILVNSGALQLALNSLRRGTQSQREIAVELELTARPSPKEPAALREALTHARDDLTQISEQSYSGDWTIEDAFGFVRSLAKLRAGLIDKVLVDV